MKYKVFVLLGLLGALTFALSGCGGAAAAEDPTKIKVGIVFDIGGKDDRSFNAAAWEGVPFSANKSEMEISPIINVILLLAFTYFIASLLVTSVNEAIGGSLKLRQKQLKAGLTNLFFTDKE